MPVDEKTLEALDLQKLPLAPNLPIVRVEAEDYTDSSGEATLRVLVVLDESIDVDSLTGEAIGELKAAIRERLRQHGVTAFPYIFLAKPSELEEPDVEG